MTLKDFISENTIDSIQYINDTIINVVCGESSYGLDVDTSNITSGTVLTTTSDFFVDVDNLIYGNVILNLETTKMLGE